MTTELAQTGVASGIAVVAVVLVVGALVLRRFRAGGPPDDGPA